MPDERTRALAPAMALVLAVASIATPSARPCTISQFELAEQQDLPPYTFVLFYKPGDDPNDQSLATLKKLELKWGKRANVAFEAIDASTERGAKLAKYWQVKKFPVTYVLAPTNWCLAAFEGRLDFAKAEALMTSPGKKKLVDAFKKNKAVFLVLGTEEMKDFDKVMKAAKSASKSVKEAMGISADVVTVDPTDQREAKLLQNLGLEKPPKQARVYVTFGKGQAVLQEVRAENEEDRLAFTVQLLATADQCSLGQEIQGEPLLLGK
ncbi:MAG: hypothetical protein R6V58_16010 [Planctomycetota bacterium]